MSDPDDVERAGGRSGAGVPGKAGRERLRCFNRVGVALLALGTLFALGFAGYRHASMGLSTYDTSHAARARRVAGVVRGQTHGCVAVPREPEREQRAQSEQRDADAVETPKALAAGFAGNARAGAPSRALHVVRIGHQGDPLWRRRVRNKEV